MGKKCTSCKSDITNDREGTGFTCPACSESVVRCGHCRKTGAPYKCKCNFEGP